MGVSLPKAEDDLRLKRHKLRIETPGGRMETVIDDPGESRKGILLIAHPHPLRGGSMENKVVHTLARAATDRDYVAVRPNFRGVGMSEGEHDSGKGEAKDMLAIIEFVSKRYPGLPWRLAGFSFGGYVQHLVAKDTDADCVILVAPAVNLYRLDAPSRPTVVIHGDEDEVVPLRDVQAWTSQQQVPLIVIHGGGHFFHGKLAELKHAVASQCRW
jgi:uncharacterized protein